MKFLILSDREYPCNESFMREVYSKRFPQLGHEVAFVMMGDNKGPDCAEWNGCPVYILSDNEYSYLRSAKNYAASDLGPLRKVLDDFGIPDVVQVRNDLSMGLYASTISNKYKIPFAYRISHLKPEAVGLQDQYNNTLDSILGNMKCKAGTKVRGKLIRDADLLLLISKEMSKYFASTTPAVIAPMGVNPTNNLAYSVNKFEEQFGSFESPKLVYLGKLSPNRKPDFLIELLRNLDKFDNYSLTVIGGQTEERIERLEKVAAQYGLESRLTITGWINDQEIVSAGLKTADIGLSPLPMNSVYKYSSPTKVIEYLEHRLPAVVSPIPDQVEVVQESGAGAVSPWRVTEFTDSIVELYKNENLDIIGKNGQKYVRQNRTYDLITEKILSSYIKYFG